jgi:uncharacterized membrane protein
MTESKIGNSDEKVLDRLRDFSDGVFGFAITLLVLNLVLPEVTTKADIAQALLHLWPKFTTFLISFVVIGLYWMMHVRHLRVVCRYDTGLLWFNLGFLLFIVVIPFTTSVLGDYFGAAGVALYAGNMALAGFMFTGLWIYAVRRGLVETGVSPAQLKRALVMNLVAPVMFTLSIGLAFINAEAAAYSWLLMIVIRPVAEWIFKVPKTGDDIR